MAEDKAKELGKKIFDAMVEIYDMAMNYKGETKEGCVFGKYTGDEAIAQMDACLKTYAEKSGVEGLVWPKVAEAKEGDDMMMMMEPEMAEGMEGGEMAEMAAEGEMGMMEASKKMSLIAADAFGEATGPAELPKLLLSLMFYHPFFGDFVKAQTMIFELGGDDPKTLGAVAAIVGAYVNAGEKADSPSFGMGCLNDDDMEELKEIAAANTE